MLNKKKMVKEPKYFWKHYRENISPDKAISQAEAELIELTRTNVIKTIIDLNYTGTLRKYEISSELIQLKGDKSFARCMSCEKVYPLTENMLNTLSMLKCDCKGKIAPSITMFGEKYLQKNTQAVKDAIFKEEEDGKVELNTHCLIFVGVDFEEDYMHELIESYSAIKTKISTDEDPYFCVMISEKDGVSIEYYQPEFATYEDIPGAINRLTAQLKEA